ncbi:hypothetical protein FOCG_17698 [Fusarium oxysporum f. sp. radicis-lycopersici 26381]|nr:hypothetical protein FOCG_17698 [Fusarium oxysporum f. sp. radicis-lycopersici 26381]
MKPPSMTFASSGTEDADFVSEDFVSQLIYVISGAGMKFIVLQDSIPDGLGVVHLP